MSLVWLGAIALVVYEFLLEPLWDQRRDRAWYRQQSAILDSIKPMTVRGGYMTAQQSAALFGPSTPPPGWKPKRATSWGYRVTMAVSLAVIAASMFRHH